MLTATRDRVQPRNTDISGYSKERDPREARRGEEVKEKRDKGGGMGPSSVRGLIPVTPALGGAQPSSLTS